MMINDRKYPVGYKLIHGNFTPKELDAENMGGCDGIIIHSLIFPSDGSRSEMTLSLDKNGQPLPDIELFKSWVLLAKRLSESKTLSADNKLYCRMVFEEIRLQILKYGF